MRALRADSVERCAGLMGVAGWILNASSSARRLVKGVWLNGWWRGFFWGLCAGPMLLLLGWLGGGHDGR
jgi:hypothetical protein